MLEIEALEREAEKQRAGGASDTTLGPSLALADSEEDEEDDEDADEDEEAEGEKERPVRLTNHTCVFNLDAIFCKKKNRGVDDSNGWHRWHSDVFNIVFPWF